MIRNTTVPLPGDAVVICHVPDYDFGQHLYGAAIVVSVGPDGVMLDDGTRVGVGSCWPTVRALRTAVELAEELRAVDDAMLRNAR